MKINSIVIYQGQTWEIIEIDEALPRGYLIKNKATSTITWVSKRDLIKKVDH